MAAELVWRCGMVPEVSMSNCLKWMTIVIIVGIIIIRYLCIAILMVITVLRSIAVESIPVILLRR